MKAMKNDLWWLLSLMILLWERKKNEREKFAWREAGTVLLLITPNWNAIVANSDMNVLLYVVIAITKW